MKFPFRLELSFSKGIANVALFQRFIRVYTDGNLRRFICRVLIFLLLILFFLTEISVIIKTREERPKIKFLSESEQDSTEQHWYIR